MKPQILLIVGIVAVVFVAGCTTTGNIFCKPNLVKSTIYGQDLSKHMSESTDCKLACYKEYGVTSYVEKCRETKFQVGSAFPCMVECYCDINNCNP